MAQTAQQRDKIRDRSAAVLSGNVQTPVQQMPDPMEARQLRLMRRLARIWAQIFRQVILEQLPRLLAATERDDRLDGLREDLRTLTATVQRRFEQRVGSRRIARELLIVSRLTNAFNQNQVNRQFRAAFNIELDDLALQEGALNAFVRRNVRLIQNLSEEQLANTRQIVLKAGREGTRNEVVRRQLQERIGVVRSRAELIARDQIGKLNSQLTQRRHQSLGVNSYTWRTSQDERVRETHAALEGTVHRYDNPPVTNDGGDTNHPGEDFNCRCTAEPVLADAVATAAATALAA